MKLLLVKSDGMTDWYTIKREEAPEAHREGLVPVEGGMAWFDSARISDACVEGPLDEMKSLAAAIRRRGHARFKRCSVFVNGDVVEFSSPRNSQTPGVATLEEADDLAAQIEVLDDAR